MLVGVGLVGNVRCRMIDPATGTVVREWTQANTITSGGLALIRDYLLQADPGAAPTPPSFMAIGSGAVQDTGYFLTALPNEGHRSGIVQRDAEGLSVVYHSYFEPTDANGQHVGTFGLYARDATDDPTTGTLVAVTNNQAPFWKDATKSFQADWVITISGKQGTN